MRINDIEDRDEYLKAIREDLMGTGRAIKDAKRKIDSHKIPGVSTSLKDIPSFTEDQATRLKKAREQLRDK